MSAFRYFSNCAVVMAIGCAPCSFHVFFTSGRLTILVISAFNRSTICFGVPAGAMRPIQIVVS
ncbi:hypothetical protein D3C83_61200 [compost metagenome]